MKQQCSIILLLVSVFAAGAATNAMPPGVKPKPVKPVVVISTKPASTNVVKVAWESFKEPGLQIMALARDGAGNVWVGTEGRGVWRRRGNEE